jgi:long-chain acyl-CoA synthetase
LTRARISDIIRSVRTTLASYLLDYLRHDGETAFVHRRGLRTGRWSYGRLARTAFQFSRELEARGIGRGDRIVLWAGNSPEWVAVFFGCLVRGAVVVPLDVQSESDFAARVARQVEAKLAILDRVTQEKADLSLPEIDAAELTSLCSTRSPEPIPLGDIDGDDAVEIVFTSGATAEPKGVLITHRNLLANLVPLEDEIRRYLILERPVHPLRFLNLLPLSHIFGQLMGMFVPPMLRGEVFFQASLAPGQIVETVKRERISVLIAVPRILDALREKIERDYEARGELERFRRAFAAARRHHPLRRWWRFRAIHSMFGLKFWAFICGGATLAPGTEEFWDRLGFAVIQGYGMTETASLVSVNHPFRLARGSIGRVMPGQEVRLADDGEILVRGRNVSTLYGSGARGTGAAADGWFHTGDVGELDGAGNLRFRGRKKDVIVTAAGMKVYPGDIEQALDREGAVKTSAVVAFAGPNGPEPLAVLVLRDPAADVKAVIEHANRSLAPHQRVRRWYVWPGEDFPRTTTQKVRTPLVAERAAAALAGVSGAETDLSGAAAQEGSPREQTEGSSAAAPPGAIGGIVARLGKGTPGSIDASATLGSDLQLDSLGRVELLSEIEERYQVEIDEAAFTEETTVGDVERMIREGAREETVSYPYPRWQQRAPLGWLRVAFIYALVLPATRLLGRSRTRGAANLRGLRGPAVFVANHVTEVDHALVIDALPARFRHRLSIAMDGEILRLRFHPPREMGPFGRALYRFEYVSLVFFFNVFSMPRKSGFRRSFAFAGEMMDRGYSLLVFPEGRHTKDGAMNPFMPGTGLLISELDAPVVPMRIDGLWALKQAGRHHAHPGEITVIVGAPVRYSKRDTPERIARDLEERVHAL